MRGMKPTIPFDQHVRTFDAWANDKWIMYAMNTKNHIKMECSLFKTYRVSAENDAPNGDLVPVILYHGTSASEALRIYQENGGELF